MIYRIIAVFMWVTICLSCQDKVTVENVETIINDAVQDDSLLQHMVIFKFLESASENDVDRLHQEFLSLKQKIPVIETFQWGLNNSPENFHQDFTHCYLLTFKNEYDRDSIYAPHPDHKEFVSNLQGVLEKVFVVDYWNNTVN